MSDLGLPPPPPPPDQPPTFAAPPAPPGFAPPLPAPGWVEPSGRSSWLVPLIVLVVLMVAGLGAFSWWVVHTASQAANRSASASLASRGLPLDPASGTDPGNGDSSLGGHGGSVDGIGCGGSEQLISHRHAHLYILKDGASQPVSAFVGIPGAPARADCFYWLHTHDRSGIIHIESPDSRVYTLGEFFDIWGQPLSRSQVARLEVANGGLTAYVDGKRYTGDPRQIHLEAYTQVVLEIGKQVTPPSYNLTGY